MTALKAHLSEVCIGMDVGKIVYVLSEWLVKFYLGEEHSDPVQTPLFCAYRATFPTWLEKKFFF